MRLLIMRHNWLAIGSLLLLVQLLLPLVVDAQYSRRRCYVCRSRGPLGDCRDPFWWNSTSISAVKALESQPCASGWCGKSVDGKATDHLMATERMCLQRPPTDGEERCSETFYENKKEPVFMCFCRGDLCNSAPTLSLLPRYFYLVVTLLCCSSIVLR